MSTQNELLVKLKELRGDNEMLRQQCRDLVHEKNYWQTKYQQADLGEKPDNEYNDYMTNHIIKDLEVTNKALTDKNTELEDEIAKLTNEQKRLQDEITRLSQELLRRSSSPTPSIQTVQSYPFHTQSMMTSHCSKDSDIEEAKAYEPREGNTMKFKTDLLQNMDIFEDDAKDTESVSYEPPPFVVDAADDNAEDKLIFGSLDVLQNAINNNKTDELEAIYAVLERKENDADPFANDVKPGVVDEICNVSEKETNLETVSEKNDSSLTDYDDVDLNENNAEVEANKMEVTEHKMDEVSRQFDSVCDFLDTVSEDNSTDFCSSDDSDLDKNEVKHDNVQTAGDINDDHVEAKLNEVRVENEVVYDGDISNSDDDDTERKKVEVVNEYISNCDSYEDKKEIVEVRVIGDKNDNASEDTVDEAVEAICESDRSFKTVYVHSNTSDGDSDLVVGDINAADHDKENRDLNENCVSEDSSCSVVYCMFSDF